MLPVALPIGPMKITKSCALVVPEIRALENLQIVNNKYLDRELISIVILV